MKYIIISLLLILNTLYGKDKLEKVSLQLHWKYQFEFAGFIAAKEKGFYEDAGLDVELKEYIQGMDIVDEILMEESNYGVYNSNLLISHLEDEPVRLMASIFKKSALVIITKPNIKNINDLIGKTIMSGTKKDFNLNFKYIFDENNIDSNDIKKIPHTYDIQGFIDDKCDAMTAFISDQPYKLDKLGIKYNIIDPSTYGMYNLQLELFTTSLEKKKYPKRTKNFKDASMKGWEYALNNIDEIVDIIHKKYNRNISIEALKYEAKITKQLILPNIYKIGTVDKNFLKKQLEILQKDMNTTKNLDEFTGSCNALLNENILLRKKEQNKYLKNKQIKMCVSTNLAPIEFYEDEKYQGITYDLINSFEEILNIKFKIIHTNSIKQSKEYLKLRKCDIIPHIPKDKNMNDYVKFTNPFNTLALVSISQNNDEYIISLENSIKNKRIALEQNSPLRQILKNLNDAVTFIDISTHKQILDTINNDKADMTFLPVPIYSYYKNKYHFDNLKIAGQSPFKVDIMMAIRDDDKLLLDIMNGAISNIAKSTVSLVCDKWTNVIFKTPIDFNLVWNILILPLLVLSIVIFFLIKQKRLNNKISQLNLTLEDRIKLEVHKNRQKDKQIIEQSRLAQMGEMISMIAHQWRQPLAAISATSGTLTIKARLNNIDKDTVLELSKNISEYSYHLSSTINDFRDFFKSNKNKQDITYDELIKDVLSIVEDSIINKNITIIKNLNSKVIFNTYSNEIKQVILNIIKNAEDILIDNNISTPAITITTQDNILTISDNAGGVPTDIITKIFDPYFSTKTKKDGTGIGLYMSKIIIDDHCNGKLSVLNDNNGAIFKINLGDQNV